MIPKETLTNIQPKMLKIHKFPPDQLHTQAPATSFGHFRSDISFLGDDSVVQSLSMLLINPDLAYQEVGKP